MEREGDIKGPLAGVASAEITITGNYHANSILLTRGLPAEDVDADGLKVVTKESCYMFGAL